VEEAWPQRTREAMEQGCLRACAAAIVQAWQDLQPAEPAEAVQLWLTGGDAERLDPLLRQQGIQAVLDPDLCLRALEQLSGAASR
jgi:pantothenate kinase type III